MSFCCSLIEPTPTMRTLDIITGICRRRRGQICGISPGSNMLLVNLCCTYRLDEVLMLSSPVHFLNLVKKQSVPMLSKEFTMGNEIDERWHKLENGKFLFDELHETHLFEKLWDKNFFNTELNGNDLYGKEFEYSQPMVKNSYVEIYSNEL